MYAINRHNLPASNSMSPVKMVSRNHLKSKTDTRKVSSRTPRRGKGTGRPSASPTCLTDSGVGGSDGDDDLEIRKESSRYDFDEFVLSTVQECQNPLDGVRDANRKDVDLWPDEDGSDSGDDVINDEALMVKRIQKKQVSSQPAKKSGGNHARPKRARKTKPNFGSFTKSKAPVVSKKPWNMKCSQSERNNDPDLTWMPIKYYANAEATHFSEIGVQTEGDPAAKKSSALAEYPDGPQLRGPFWGTMALIQSLSMERFSWNTWVKFIEQSSGLGGADSFGLYKWSTRKRQPGGPSATRGDYSQATVRQRFRGRQLLIQGTKFPDIDPDHFQLPDYLLPPQTQGFERLGGNSFDKTKTPGELSILLGKARNRRKIVGAVSMDSGLSSAESKQKSAAAGKREGESRKSSQRVANIQGRRLPHPGETNMKVDKNTCHLSIHLPALGDSNESVPSSPLIRSPGPDTLRFDDFSTKSQNRPSFIYSSGNKQGLSSPRVRPQQSRQGEKQRTDKQSQEFVDLPMSVVKLPQIAPASNLVVRTEDSVVSSPGDRRDSDQWLEQLNMYRRQAMGRSPEVPPGTPVSLPPPLSGQSDELESQSPTYSLLPPRKSIPGTPRPSTPMASTAPNSSASRRSSVTSSITVKLPNINEDKSPSPRSSYVTREPVKMPSLNSGRSLSNSLSDDCIDEDSELN